MSNIWNDCLHTLKEITPIAAYTQYLLPTNAKQNKNTLTLLVANEQALAWINNNNIKYAIKALIAKKYPHIQLKITLNRSNKTNLSSLLNRLNKTLIPEYTFERLVVGDTNEIAHHAAMQIAKNPVESDHFPFIIYGDCGIGKTHLLHAIGHFTQNDQPHLNIIYTPLMDFVKNITIGIRHQHVETIKHCYQSADLLLIDDIHHIAEKEKSQEEFFYVFDYLFKQKKQIIMTCDQVPNSLKKIQRRLISRLTQGLVLPVKPPGLEMRAAILIKKASYANIDLSEEAVLFIANEFRDNVRELEGALNRLKAVKSFTQNNNLKIDQVKEALNDLIIQNKRIVDIENIQQIICRYYGISHANLVSKRRLKTLVYPRQMAMYLAKELTTLSLSEIAAYFKRDHTTVIHANKKIQTLLSSQQNTQEDYKNIKTKIHDV